MPPWTSPASPSFQPSKYWRGPTWPFLNLLLGWALDRGDADLRAASLSELADLAFDEYCQPFTGEPLGSHDQSWTAAAALEWAGELGVDPGYPRPAPDWGCGDPLLRGRNDALIGHP